jgi:acetyl-CoA carboxylase biotin carboxyl carrier protein
MTARDLVARFVDGELRSPGVGYWRGAPAAGTEIAGGDAIGELEVLGVRHRLVAPPEARGVVAEGGPAEARVAVGYGERLLTLDQASPTQPSARRGDGPREGALVLRSPTSGRFYRRPGPGKPPFVEVGDEIAAGHTVCLLEVMKTFHRVGYGGEGFPQRARVTAVVPEDECDLDAGDVILQLEPA